MKLSVFRCPLSVTKDAASYPSQHPPPRSSDPCPSQVPVNIRGSCRPSTQCTTANANSMSNAFTCLQPSSSMVPCGNTLSSAPTVARAAPCTRALDVSAQSTSPPTSCPSTSNDTVIATRLARLG